MAVSELVPGKLYKQLLQQYNNSPNAPTRTVMCVKYEQWRIYKKATFIVLGQPDKPIVEEMVDKFQLNDWLYTFSEVSNEE